MNGLIVLIYLPVHAPENIKSALKPIIGNGHTIRYDSIKLDECDILGYRPVESFLCSHFELDLNSDSYVEKTTSSIYDKIPTDTHRVIVFENVSCKIIGHFKDFLIDLSRYNQSKPIYERHKFIVILDPRITNENDLPSEAGLSKHYYRNISTSFDLTYVLRYQLRSHKTSKKTLEESIAISLSRFDFRLCEHLSTSPDIINDFDSYIKNYANEKQWNAIEFNPIDKLTEAELWIRWAAGLLEYEDNEAYYNLAYLAIHNQDRYVENAIWLALLKTLLPAIEEYRTKIIECKKIIFPFKHQNEFGTIKSNKYDFEIGDIVAMLKTNQITFKYFSSNEKNRIIQFINLCKTIRDDLAHHNIPKTIDIQSFMKDVSEMKAMLKN